MAVRGNTVAGTEPRAFGRRISTETKAAYKTTEFAVYVVVFLGILLASFLVKTGQDGQRVDSSTSPLTPTSSRLSGRAWLP